MAVVDLSRLSPPDVVEALDYDAVVAAMTADLRARYPEFDAWVESDPALKLIEVAAYREMLVRHRVNRAARAVMLAFAAGTDLEHLAALYGVTRAVVGTDPLVLESDARLLTRVQTALSGLSTAGSRDAYVHHALSADARARDVCVERTAPGAVRVVVLGGDADGDGVPSSAVVERVRDAITGDTVRPLTDAVRVQAVEIVPYTINATLTIESGPDPDVVLAAARTAAEAHVRARNRCGVDVHRAAVSASLFVAGVTDVALTAPAADVAAASHQAPWCTASAAAAYTTPVTHPLDGITLAAA